jgi:hypothetical protein
MCYDASAPLAHVQVLYDPDIQVKHNGKLYLTQKLPSLVSYFSMVYVLAQFRYDLNFHPPFIKNPQEMTSKHQVALARAHRMPPPSNRISKAARQVVPAFL